MEQEIKEYTRNLFKYYHPLGDFDKAWEDYKKTPMHNNYGPPLEISMEVHNVMKLVARFHIRNALQALKYDIDGEEDL